MAARIRPARALLIPALSALALAACASTKSGTVQQSTTPTVRVPTSTTGPCVIRPPSISGTPLKPVFTLPPGYNGPDWLASTPGKDDLWVVSPSAADVRAFHFVPATGAVTSFPIAAGGPGGLEVGGNAGLAVAPDGEVWFGAGQALIGLDPATGGHRSVNVPATSPLEKLQSVAVDPLNGDVAVAFSSHQPVQRVIIYDPSSGTSSAFTPAGEDPVASIAYSSDGTLGVLTGGGTGAVDLLSPDGRVSEVTAPSAAFVPFGRAFLGVDNPMEIITPPRAGAAAHVATVAVPAALRVQLLSGGPAGSSSQVALGATADGLLVFDALSSHFTALTFPKTCVQTADSTATVQYLALALAFDASGDAFLMLNLDRSEVFEIPSSRL